MAHTTNALVANPTLSVLHLSAALHSVLSCHMNNCTVFPPVPFLVHLLPCNHQKKTLAILILGLLSKTANKVGPHLNFIHDCRS